MRVRRARGHERLTLPSKRWIVLVAAVAALALGAPIAWADFTDVPPSNPFYADINAIQGAGITSGCGGGNFCPTDNITRQAEAAFVHRAGARAAFSSSGDYTDLNTSTRSDLAVATIDTGGVAGGTGFVVVNASALGFQSAGASTTPSRLNIRITQDGGAVSDDMYETMMPDASGDPNPNVSASQTWVFAVPTATTQTFRLQAYIDWGSGPMSARGRISAVYVPFGSTGASTLAPAVSTGSTSAANRP